MIYADDITGLIGNTPMVRLNKVFPGGSNLVLAKLEQFNPCSSIKDRTALGMVNDAERKGKIKPGSTLVEATSGNTGIALAFIAAARGYHLIIVMPDAVGMNRSAALKLFGASVELTPAHLGMEGAIRRAEDILIRHPEYFMVRQFENPANPMIHAETTGREILHDTGGKVNMVFAGTGTGGTISGIGRFLKAHDPGIKIIGVEPLSSSVIKGGAPGPHQIQGIGPGFKPAVLDESVIDDIVPVSDESAFKLTRALIKQEGIFAGISSGAATAAAVQYIKEKKIRDSNIVIIFPDSAEKYLENSRLTA